MENKQKNKSINSVIYLLLGAMLIGVVTVSVFTVSSRRGEKPRLETAPETSVETGETAQSGLFGGSDTEGTAESEKKPAETSGVTSGSKTAETAASPESETAASAKVPEVPTAAELRYFVIPVAGTVSKSFEIDVPVYSMTMNDYRAHTGVDISAPIGSEVISASSGTVCKVWSDPLMGSSVTVDHGDGIYTTYMNLSEELASGIAVGQKVAMGQSLGAVGESAMIEISEEPHLHLEMKVDGAYVDPLEYMGVASPQEIVYED